MNRNVRWFLTTGLLLATTIARGQSPYQVTTLPRPAELTQVPVEPLPPPRPDDPKLPPAPPANDWFNIQPGPATQPVEETPFRRRVRADLLEAAFLFPFVSQNLNAQFNVNGQPTDARLPTAELGFSAPAIVNIQIDAWRYGDINLGYRWLAAEGNAVVLGFAAPAILRSRLDMHVFDVTFASAGYGPLWNMLWFVNRDPVHPQWGLRWDVGARLASFFFDSRTFSTVAGPTTERHVSSYFIGGGPHVGMTLSRWLGDSGVSLFGRSDFGMNMGTVRQQFSEQDPQGNFGYFARTNSQTVPTLVAQLGFSGEPPLTIRGRWEVAYQYERWWSIATIGGSTGDLINHGIVLRWFHHY